MLRSNQIHAGKLWRLPPADYGPCQRDSSGLEGAGTGDGLSTTPPLLSSDSRKCALPAGEDALAWRGSGPGRKKEAVGKAGGGEREVGERGSMAGKVDWEKPGQEGRFPLSLDFSNSLEAVITIRFLAHHLVNANNLT